MEQKYFMKIKGNFIDIGLRSIYPASLVVNAGRVESVVKDTEHYDSFIMPGLIDSHIHIESSMCSPGAFAVAAVSRGTTSVVSDPHEIANVLGVEGVEFMIEDSRKVPLKFFFGAPSCVPATSFETSGASIGTDDIKYLMAKPEIKFLSEVMNFPGVVNGSNEVMDKIKIANKVGKPVDGHAPGLKGVSLNKYISAGISTDHECGTIEEAEEKIAMGMKIQIREGSAARNFDSLKELVKRYPEKVMLCSDDLHPEMLLRGHINLLVARLVSEGFDVFDTLKSCTVNPASHYGLNTGLLKPGMPADFIVVDDPAKMNVLETYIDGKKVFDRGEVLFDYSGASPVNNFNCSKVGRDEIEIIASSDQMRVIRAFDGQLYTAEEIASVVVGSEIKPDNQNDLLKLVVKDRYRDAPPTTAFIKGFGLKSGAFASSIAHDSHNIISIGTDDDDIVNAINEIVDLKGGLSFVRGEERISLQLPIGGIMSDRPVVDIAGRYEYISERIRANGGRMEAPFMSLSFMSLLVIPELKLSDKGLFRLSSFDYVPLFI